MSETEALRCVVLGAGGHARVVIDALRASRVAIPSALLDADPRLWGKELMGVKIIGGDDQLGQLKAEGVGGFVIGLGAVGDNRPRRRLFTMALAHGLTPVTIRHPQAVCSGSAQIGPGSVVLACAVINAGASVGVNVIVNTGAIVEHECVVEDHAHLATGSRLASRVRVGPYAHVGLGASVRQGITIGEGAVVGAGAVVVKDVEAWTVVVGVPARKLRAVDTRAASSESGFKRAAFQGLGGSSANPTSPA